MAEVFLSEGEWKIMKVLWGESPRTIGQLVEVLKDETGWSKTTIFVMLKRMMGKGAVRMDDSGRCQQYYPLIKREEASLAETASFLEKVYDGSVGMMISSLADKKALSKEEIAELRQILDHMDE